jgi:hypothetical protein
MEQPLNLIREQQNVTRSRLLRIKDLDDWISLYHLLKTEGVIGRVNVGPGGTPMDVELEQSVKIEPA